MTPLKMQRCQVLHPARWSGTGRAYRPYFQFSNSENLIWSAFRPPPMLRKICAVFSDGRTVLLLTPGTGNMQACLRHQATRDTIRRRRQVTKLPKPIPQHPPFSQRYGFLRIHCYVLALPMPSYKERSAFDAIVGTNDERKILLSRRSSFAGCLCVGPILQQCGACILI